MKTRILLVLIAGILLLTGCSSIIQGNQKAKQEKNEASNIISVMENLGFVRMKGYSKNNQLYYNCQLNGQDTDFILNSGARLSLITYGQAMKFGLIDEQNVTDDGSLITAFETMNKGEEVLIKNLAIPGYEFTNWSVRLVERSNKIMIIGQDFLLMNNSILLCNYGILMNNSEYEDHDALDMILSEEGYVKIPLRDQYGIELTSKNSMDTTSVFYVTVKINKDREGLMMVDTGAVYTSINDDHSNYRHSAVKRSNMRMFDASRKGKDFFRVKLDSLKIDEHLFLDHQKIGIVDTDIDIEKAQNTPQKISGFIGMDLLMEKKVIIDFGNRVLYFKKN